MQRLIVSSLFASSSLTGDSSLGISRPFWWSPLCSRILKRLTSSGYHRCSQVSSASLRIWEADIPMTWEICRNRISPVRGSTRKVPIRRTALRWLRTLKSNLRISRSAIWIGLLLHRKVTSVVSEESSYTSFCERAIEYLEWLSSSRTRVQFHSR